MAGQFGVVRKWNTWASTAVIRISKETKKTVTASEFSSWARGEWGRETRIDRAKVAARFDTQESAQAAADAAQAAYKLMQAAVDDAAFAMRSAKAAQEAAALEALAQALQS